MVTITNDDQGPVVQVISPNGGETLLTGSQAKLSWTADDNKSAFGGPVYDQSGKLRVKTGVQPTPAFEYGVTWLAQGMGKLSIRQTSHFLRHSVRTKRAASGAFVASIFSPSH